VARVYPNGSADVNQFQAAGGPGFVIRELLEAGCLHGDVVTVAAGGLADYARVPERQGGKLAWAALPAASGDEAVVRPATRPFSEEGGLKLLEGNCGRAVMKVSSVPADRWTVEAPAAVFDSQEAMLEAFMGHQVAWEYFENRDPYRAFVEEVCTGDEFFKYRHLDEEALANALLEQLSGEPDFPTVICGHSHEPRDRSRFDNRSGILPPHSRDPGLFTRYMNTGSVGRFENLAWCVEIHHGRARVVSWSNAGTADDVRPERSVWESDDSGTLIGTLRGEP
jgi:hypothetical protein